MPHWRTPSKHLERLVQPMKEFNEAQSTNEYLIGELVIARKRNEVLTEHIATLVKHIDKLQDDIKISSQLLNACVAWMS